jgi:hypothetical protein
MFSFAARSSRAESQHQLAWGWPGARSAAVPAALVRIVSDQTRQACGAMM